MSIFILMSVLLLGPCAASVACHPLAPQDRDQRERGTEAGLRVLAQVDKRLYYPSERGLRALSFTFRPQLNDVQAEKAVGPAPFRLRYMWRAGVGEKMVFVTDDGKVSEDLETKAREDEKPEETRKRKLAVRRQLLLNCRNILGFFLGKRLQDRFTKHHITVTRKKVGDFEEVKLVIEPRNPVKVRRIIVSLDRQGLPWKWERLYVDGHQQLDQNEYARRPPGHVLSSYKRYVTPPSAAQKGFSYAFEIKYQKVGGFLLPSRMRKAGQGLEYSQKGATSFNEVLVNENVPAFVPIGKAAGKPAEKTGGK